MSLNFGRRVVETANDKEHDRDMCWQFIVHNDMSILMSTVSDKNIRTRSYSLEVQRQPAVS